MPVLPRRLIVWNPVPGLPGAVGTLSYPLPRDKTLSDALYLTVVTLTTVGYGDEVPKTGPGKLFTIFLALGGIFTLFYAAAEVIRTVISGEVQGALGRRRMEHSLAEMRDHLIVCGYGRMGRLVAKEFSAQELPFVVVEREAEALEDFALPHALPLHGDATSDEVLKHAGVERARALVTVLASDADNLFITMSARLLNEKLFIVARAEAEPAERKLLRAGASRVVSPYVIGGFRVAQAVLRPAVVDFIELATRTEHLELQIEEAQVAPRSRLANLTLRQSKLRKELGVIIVAIKIGRAHV